MNHTMKFTLDLDGGEYTYRFDNGKQDALRNGEPWRDLTGDNLVYWLAAEVRSYREACGGLVIPGDAPPGIFADFVKSMRLIGSQALSSDWTAEQAFHFMRTEAREALDRLNVKRTPATINRHCAEDDAEEARRALRELRDAVDKLNVSGKPIRGLDMALRNAMKDADGILGPTVSKP